MGQECMMPFLGMDNDGAVKARTPWWMWLSFLGLKAPVAAMAWAYAYFRVFHLVRDIYWAYQFLFVAIWCVIMGSRLIVVFRDEKAALRDSRLFFARSNCVWLGHFVVVAVVCGLWIIQFQVGTGMLSIARLPLLLSLAYLIIRTTVQTRRPNSSWVAVGCFCAAAAFSFGVSIPAYFYGMPNDVLGFFFYTPTWFLTVFVYLAMMYRKRWLMPPGSRREDESGEIALSFGLLVLLGFCFVSGWQIGRMAERWFFFGLGMGAALLFIVERWLGGRVSRDALCTLGWASLVLPALFISWMLY